MSPEWRARFAEDAVRALGDLGQEMRDTAVRICPVDTGMLRDSITSEVGVVFDTPILRLSAGDPVIDYAGYVELGTRYQEPQPFLRPAVFTTH